MVRFKTKPPEIEAFQVSECIVIPPTETFYQNTFVVYPGDYLCIDAQGFKFPCRPEVFEKLYEPMAE
ncbi:MAG: hypothetical protein BA871_17465 [Desulfuromonadales bacterium C00003096]|jgi:hypothetical protein|nr:MAG: hypothetical protein BA871_17465 [Desulfuromonadales bacterium C00003096]